MNNKNLNKVLSLISFHQKSNSSSTFYSTDLEIDLSFRKEEIKLIDKYYMLRIYIHQDDFLYNSLFFNIDFYILNDKKWKIDNYITISNEKNIYITLSISSVNIKTYFMDSLLVLNSNVSVIIRNFDVPKESLNKIYTAKKEKIKKNLEQKKIRISPINNKKYNTSFKCSHAHELETNIKNTEKTDRFRLMSVEKNKKLAFTDIKYNSKTIIDEINNNRSVSKKKSNISIMKSPCYSIDSYYEPYKNTDIKRNLLKTYEKERNFHTSVKKRNKNNEENLVYNSSNQQQSILKSENEKKNMKSKENNDYYEDIINDIIISPIVLLKKLNINLDISAYYDNYSNGKEYVILEIFKFIPKNKLILKISYNNIFIGIDIKNQYKKYFLRYFPEKYLTEGYVVYIDNHIVKENNLIQPYSLSILEFLKDKTRVEKVDFTVKEILESKYSESVKQRKKNKYVYLNNETNKTIDEYVYLNERSLIDINHYLQEGNGIKSTYFKGKLYGKDKYSRVFIFITNKVNFNNIFMSVYGIDESGNRVIIQNKVGSNNVNKYNYSLSQNKSKTKGISFYDVDIYNIYKFSNLVLEKENESNNIKEKILYTIHSSEIFFLYETTEKKQIIIKHKENKESSNKDRERHNHFYSKLHLYNHNQYNKFINNSIFNSIHIYRSAYEIEYIIKRGNIKNSIFSIENFLLKEINCDNDIIIEDADGNELIIRKYEMMTNRLYELLSDLGNWKFLDEQKRIYVKIFNLKMIFKKDHNNYLLSNEESVDDVLNEVLFISLSDFTIFMYFIDI